MPELPEVERFKKYVDDTSLHQPIVEAKSSAQGMLIDTSEARLRSALAGNAFEQTFRHGKFLFVKLTSGDWLMLHFGMTGDLLYDEPDARSPKPYVLLIKFKNGKHLLFSDPRRLGRLAIVEDPEEFVFKRGYGKDALLITQEEFVRRVHKKRTSIKATLLDQKVVAGVGNEFSDEILFQSKIHPASLASKLSEKQLIDLFRHMRSILQEAVRHDADRDQLTHYFFLGNRRAGLRCPRCGGVTEWQTLGGRSSYFCPACQKLYG
jgi:formamidopyrimidine-DNA glycosylase